MASIFPDQKFIFENGQVDYQTAHARFAEDTNVCRASVMAFLKSHGVE